MEIAAMHWPSVPTRFAKATHMLRYYVIIRGASRRSEQEVVTTQLFIGVVIISLYLEDVIIW